MASIQHQARRRQADWLNRVEGSVRDKEGRDRSRENVLTPAERREYAIQAKALRREKGLVDGLRFKTETEAAEYLRKREEEDSAHRPDRQRETKKRVSFEQKAGLKERAPDFEKQKEMVAAMSREKAQRMVEVMKAKYGGSIWPADVRRLYRLLVSRAITVEPAAA